MRPETLAALGEAQRLGFLGSRPVELAAEHALGFADALGELAAGSRLIDLGSGGGLPGLVLAEVYPHCAIELVDRRQKRTDFLERAVRRLALDHVTVRCVDAQRIADTVASGSQAPYDAVTARGFGPPEQTLRLASRLVVTSGTIVISEPPDADRWPSVLLRELGLAYQPAGAMARFTVLDES